MAEVGEYGDGRTKNFPIPNGNKKKFSGLGLGGGEEVL